VKPHPGPSFGREPWQTHSLEGGPDDLPSRPQRVEARQLEGQLDHIEELQLFVPGVAEDRISDLTGSILRDFFAEYTAEQAQKLKLPTRRFPVGMVWDAVDAKWKAGPIFDLPYNPIDSTPLLLAPLNLLRHLPWINYEDFYRSYFSRYVLPADRSVAKVPKPDVLAYNRANYEIVQRYVEEKERTAAQCRPTPLFEPLRLATLKTKFKKLRATPTGAGGNDKAYEAAAYELLSSMLYPELELAASQVRTISGVHIRDVLFYNDGKTQFLHDLREQFGARQLVFELKERCCPRNRACQPAIPVSRRRVRACGRTCDSKSHSEKRSEKHRRPTLSEAVCRHLLR